MDPTLSTIKHFAQPRRLDAVSSTHVPHGGVLSRPKNPYSGIIIFHEGKDNSSIQDTIPEVECRKSGDSDC